MRSDLRVFVYGTLKKGFSNHERYCAGVLRITPAWLRGRLYRFKDFPTMSVPEEDILCFGTTSPTEDVETQERFDLLLKSNNSVGLHSPFGPWRAVKGELHTFEDAQSRLPLLDELEGFRPGHQSEYLRVLVYVNLSCDLRTSAWTYISGFEPGVLEEYPRDSWDLKD